MILLQLVLSSTLVLAPGPFGPAPADTLIDVGGHKLRLEVREGTRPLTIVLEAGGGADRSSWASVPDALAWQTGATVVTYDRAGLGESELGPAELTPQDEVRDLRHALDHLGVPDPTLLVATSYGAMLAILHAGLYPDHVPGLVLVDPMNAVFIEETGDFLRSTVPDIQEPANDRERVILRMVRTLPDLKERSASMEPGLAMPVVVITAGEPWWGSEEIDRAWRQSHEVIAGRSSDRELVVAEASDHDVPEKRPVVIVEAVSRILARIDRSQ